MNNNNNNNNNKEEDQLVLVSEDGWVMQDCGNNLNIPKNSKGSFCNVSDNIGYSSRSKYVA
jgi:hypothetical protein